MLNEEYDLTRGLIEPSANKARKDRRSRWIREHAYRHDSQIPFKVRCAVIEKTLCRSATGRLLMSCEVCRIESGMGFEIHHEYYIKDGGRIHYSETYGKQGHQYGAEGAGDLLLLCAACHRNKHGI